MLRFDISHEFQGTGVSKGLERGLVVYYDDILLMEEGMGLGACALQTGGYTYFTSIKRINKVKNSINVVCHIDRRLVWQVLGIKSNHFTRILEYLATNIYMKHENRQAGLLKLGGLLQKLFRVKASFVNVSSQGEARINYELGDTEISIDLSCKTEKRGCKLFVMNELGGTIFGESIINGVLSVAPSGWQKIEGSCELYSRVHSLAFTIVERDVPDTVRSALFWGRELVNNNYCWAGFESELLCDAGNFKEYRYSIKFREVAI